MRVTSKAPPPVPEPGGTENPSHWVSVPWSHLTSRQTRLLPQKGRSFSIPRHPYHILFLGHCQPTKQNFQQADGGAGQGQSEEPKDAKSRNPGAPSCWPHRERLSSHRGRSTTCWGSRRTVRRAHDARKGRGILRCPDTKPF